MSGRGGKPGPDIIITGAYAVFGFLWILFSDRLLRFMATDIETFARLQTYKGWLYVVITAVMIFLLVRILFRRQQELLNKTVVSEERLLHSLQEKETLLKELNHRVKNNLQIISSMLNMSAEKIPETQSREPFRRAQERIISMALVHDQFYQSGDLTAINFKGYILNLISRLQSSYTNGGSPPEVEADISDIPLRLETAVPLGLIVSELLLNSFQHAFPEGKAGKIFVSCAAEDKVLIFRVTDDGIGIDPEAQDSGGLGLTIVQALTDQLAGSLSFPDIRGRGMTAVLEVTLPQV